MVTRPQSVGAYERQCLERDELRGLADPPAGERMRADALDLDALRDEKRREFAAGLERWAA